MEVIFGMHPSLYNSRSKKDEKSKFSEHNFKQYAITNAFCRAEDLVLYGGYPAWLGIAGLRQNGQMLYKQNINAGKWATDDSENAYRFVIF